MLDATPKNQPLTFVADCDNHYLVVIARSCQGAAKRAARETAAGSKEGKRETKVCALCIPDASTGRAVCIPEGFAERVLCIPDGSAGRTGCIRHSTFGSQPLSIHTLTNFVSVSRLESTLTKTSRKSIKTRDFKSFRIRSYATRLHKPLIKQHLHIHGGRGEGALCLIILLYLLCLLPPPGSNVAVRPDPSLSTFNCGLLTLLPQPATGETRFPPHTSNPIGRRVPGLRGWL
jgi:hypothetical protein